VPVRPGIIGGVKVIERLAARRVITLSALQEVPNEGPGP
jgi:hypothetical protein